MKLYYRQVGETGQPIIILHGIFGSSDNWLTISKTIAEAGYRVYLVDQRNHGRSPRSDVHDYESMAADLMEFITEHALENPILVGHSMGGKVVMQFAMDYPNQKLPGEAAPGGTAANRFSRLVIVDIAPRFYPVHHANIIRGFNAIDLPSLKSRNEADTILSRYEPNLGVRQFLLKNLYRTEAGPFDWRLNLPVIERELHGIGEELRHVHTVTEPTLFVRGSESGYVRDEDIQTISKIFPNATVETIEGASHWVQAEKPKEFVEVLLHFLKN